MDEELRNYLTAMEDRLKAHVDERVERSARATAAEIGALHTYIQQVEARLTARIDAQGVRIDRHAGLLQSGARQIMRTFENQEQLSRLWQ
ncbi:MAG: hypothetical protein KGN36_00670, partial [Acidobacteriota bacterium]|nr:hypothetical protein [Acidobacteriota bacterium]